MRANQHVRVAVDVDVDVDVDVAVAVAVDVDVDVDIRIKRCMQQHDRPVTQNKYVAYLVQIPYINIDDLNTMFAHTSEQQQATAAQKKRVFEWVPASLIIANTICKPLYPRINRDQLVKNLLEITASVNRESKEQNGYVLQRIAAHQAATCSHSYNHNNKSL
jgi:hypothetical protein